MKKRTPNETPGRYRCRPGTSSLLIAGLLLTCLGSLQLAACADAETGKDERGTRETSTRASGSARPVKVAGFQQPVEVKFAPGFPRLMFVVEQAGRVMVIRRGRKVKRPFLDVRSKVGSGGEMGLLSIAFPDNYRKSRRFYLYYTARDGSIVVEERRRRATLVASPTYSRRVIRIPHPDNRNHYGGQMHFLGSLLYFGTGDGGGANDPGDNAQSPDTLLGKMVRIHPRPARGRPYSVPPSNPLVGVPGRDEIFSFGLRNPFRWSFVKRTGNPTRMAIADVGQNRFEEINYPTVARARGANFGWPNHEGPEPARGEPIPERIDPVLSLPHPTNCSVIGGIEVRDRSLRDLRGRYVFADFCRPSLLGTRLSADGGTAVRNLGLSIPRVTSLAEDGLRRVWVSSLNGGVYRLAPAKGR